MDLLSKEDVVALFCFSAQRASAMISRRGVLLAVFFSVLTSLPACKRAARPVAGGPNPSGDSTVPSAVVHASAYRQEAGKPVQVSPGSSFKNGDKVRLELVFPRSGYLFLVARAPSGKLEVLYPNSRIKLGGNGIAAGQKVTAPAEGWIRLPGIAGEEVVYAVYSTRPDSSLMVELTTLLNARFRGNVAERVGASATDAAVLEKLSALGQEFAPVSPPALPSVTAVPQASPRPKPAPRPQAVVLPIQEGEMTVGILRFKHG